MPKLYHCYATSSAPSHLLFEEWDRGKLGPNSICAVGCPTSRLCKKWEPSGYLTGRLPRDAGRGESRWCRHLGRQRRGGSRLCATEVRLLLEELSRHPRPIVRNGEVLRRFASRRACSSCGHHSWLDRSRKSASLRFPIAVDLLLGDAEFGQELLMGSAFVMLRPFAGFRESLLVCRCE
jgi:hypothetical protein